MMSMKLDTAALERLMDSDNGQEIKLELQQAVIEEFGRRHIKAFANDGEFKKHVDIAKKEAIKDIESMFGEWKGSYNSKRFELNSQISSMVKLQAKTAVTYELDKVENYVADLYTETAARIKEEYELKSLKLQKDLEKYSQHLEEEVETIKAQLLTDKVDGILRNHVKNILAETFSVGA